jgi:hypothetical protein
LSLRAFLAACAASYPTRDEESPMRLAMIPLILLATCAFGADTPWENSVLSLQMPEGVTINDSDFDYVPEASWKLMLDGRPVVIGMQRTDDSSQAQMLERVKANVLRHVTGGNTRDLSTWGNLERCKGIEVSGKSTHPSYPGDVTVYAVSFSSGRVVGTDKMSVVLVAIDQKSDPRFAAAIKAVRQSLKLKNN